MKRKKNEMNNKSFYFNDYNHFSKNQLNKNGINISEDRIYLLFFVFICLISIFSIKIFITSIQGSNFKNSKN